MNRLREIELKLELEPRKAGSLRHDLGFGNGQAKPLIATYYDTPDGSLRDRGISFRIRCADGHYVQTIKVARGPAAGLFDRAEWERSLPDDTPDLAAVDEACLRDALADPDAWDALQPVFKVDVERTTWQVPLDDGMAEVVLDRGHVLADGAQDVVSELELELKAGAPDQLFRLARRLATAMPTRLGVLSKAERGYRLLDGKTGQPTKAEPLRLPPDTSTAEAFAIIVQACLRHFRLNEPLIAARNAAGLHQARVALRRLRSAISLFRDVVADDRVDAIKMGLRNLASVLGAARNLDVLLERLAAEHKDAPALRLLRAEREAAYDQALDQLASENAPLLMLDVLEWAEMGKWRSAPPSKVAPLLTKPADEFAAQVLGRYRRRVKRRGDNFADLDRDARHRVRIEAKKLRYAVEFFASLFDAKKDRRRAKKFQAALEDLQTSLGALNDVATGEELLHSLAAKGIDVPIIISRDDEAQLVLDAEAAHERLVDAKRFWR